MSEPVPLSQFDTVEAEFRPTRTDDLRPGAAAFIGRRMRWQAVYLITTEDHENYAGDFAMAPLCDEPVPFGWVPQRDLVDITDRRSI